MVYNIFNTLFGKWNPTYYSSGAGAFDHKHTYGGSDFSSKRLAVQAGQVVCFPLIKGRILLTFCETFLIIQKVF